MTTKTVGRNDPCPCGSGKKYKHCCMHKDREAERAAKLQAASPAPIEPPPEEPSVDISKEEAIVPDAVESEQEIDPFDEIWDAFMAADYEEKVALFYQTLDEGLMDEEIAFEMLDALFSGSIAAGERDRFNELVEALRQQSPEAYAHNIAYIMDWVTSNIVASGQYDRLQSMTADLTAASRDIDIFNYIISRLAYHGQDDVIAQVTHDAWPQVRESDNIIPLGIDEFAQRGADFAIFQYIEAAPEGEAMTKSQYSELLEIVEYFIEPNEEYFFDYVALLTGSARRHWALDGSDLIRLPDPMDAEGSEESPANTEHNDSGHNLWELCVQFMGYLHRVEGVPYAKAWLGHNTLLEYLIERKAGELKRPERDLFSDLLPKRKGRGKRKKRQRKVRNLHPLYPDHSTFDYFLAQQFGFLAFGLYRAAAVYELIPAWLRFLESVELLDADQRQAALTSLASLTGEMKKAFEVHSQDPTISRNIANAWA